MLRGSGHHHLHVGAGLDQQAAQFRRLVGGNPAGHPQNDFFVFQRHRLDSHSAFH